VGLATITPYYWSYSAGKVEASSGIYLKGQGATAWTLPSNYIRAGDRVLISTTASAGVSTITSATAITLDASVATFAASTAYVIKRALHHDDKWSYDATVVNNTLVISDRTRPLYGFNGTTFSNYMVSAYRPGCVVFYKDRLFVGNTVESTGPGTTSEYRQRIRWTGVTGNPRSFTAADYLDLPYTPGMLTRLVPLGNLIVAYFEDALFYGVPTNNPDLPYAFHRIETPGVGLAGPHAVCGAMGGHFFVGQDSVYYLGTDPRAGPEDIGIPIVEESIATCGNLKGVYAAADPLRHRVVFGFPTTGTAISKIWSFDLRSKAWSYEDVAADMLANPLLVLGLTIDDLTGTIDGLDATYPTIDGMSAAGGSSDLFVGQNGTLYKVATGTTTDTWSVPSVEVEFPDIDMEAPGIDKTFLEMLIRLADAPAVDVTFVVSGSDDSGTTWTTLGDMVVEAGTREGRLTFAITGNAIRFRLVSTTTVAPYTITSAQWRVRGRARSTELD
jgi:hypothetical protein